MGFDYQARYYGLWLPGGEQRARNSYIIILTASPLFHVTARIFAQRHFLFVGKERGEPESIAGEILSQNPPAALVNFGRLDGIEVTL